MNRLKFEFSSGGLALKGRPPKILMVQVKNLKGKIVWTFPKGHIEKGESSRDAALREVLEETGWKCEIRSAAGRAFEKVRYFFIRGRQTIKKEVIWYLMAPVKKIGERDPREIRKVKWVALGSARKLAQYPSDKKLLEKLSPSPGSKPA